MSVCGGQGGARTASPTHHASCQSGLMDHLDTARLVSPSEQSVPPPQCHRPSPIDPLGDRTPLRPAIEPLMINSQNPALSTKKVKEQSTSGANE